MPNLEELEPLKFTDTDAGDMKFTDIGTEDIKLRGIGAEDTKFTDTGAQNTSMLVAYHRIYDSKNSDKKDNG